MGYFSAFLALIAVIGFVIYKGYLSACLMFAAACFTGFIQYRIDSAIRYDPFCKYQILSFSLLPFALICTALCVLGHIVFKFIRRNVKKRTSVK